MYRSFKYAIRGIAKAFIRERNMKLHVAALFGIGAAGFYYHITNLEWIAIIVCSGMVMCAEIFNTAIEETIDYISLEKVPKAGLIKDLAAGAVLVTAISAIIVAAIIFIPRMM